MKDHSDAPYPTPGMLGIGVSNKVKNPKSISICTVNWVKENVANVTLLDTGKTMDVGLAYSAIIPLHLIKPDKDLEVLGRNHWNYANALMAVGKPLYVYSNSRDMIVAYNRHDAITIWEEKLGEDWYRDYEGEGLWYRKLDTEEIKIDGESKLSLDWITEFGRGWLGSTEA